MRAVDLLFRRYLEQRREFGETELILRPETLRAIDALRTGEVPAVAASERVGVEAAPSPAAPPRLEPESTPRTSAPAVPLSDTRSPAAAALSVPVARLESARSLELLRQAAAGCTSCGLASSRTRVVFGEGDPSARLVLVGEAPGADEDRSGRPFVGRAGKLLDVLLTAIGMPRESVYVCNVLKCRPPANRNPLPEEVRTCSPFLHRQLEFVDPAAILALGAFSAQTLLETTETIGQIRGSRREYRGIPLIATYHPAALLRNPGWIRPVWEDLQRLRAVLD